MLNLAKLKDEKDLLNDKEGSKIWTIGNLNGDFDQLEKVILNIEESNLLASNDLIVFLGNFIGIGNKNKDIIDLLYNYQDIRQKQVVILRGVNEQRMSYSTKAFFESDIGKDTINAYREMKLPIVMKRSELEIEEFSNARSWISALPTFCVTKNFYFTHSGVDSTLPLNKQSSASIIFSQEHRPEDPFFKGKTDYDKCVIHSHNGNKVVVKKNRIAVGCGKEISMVILDDENKDKKIEIRRI